VYFVIPSAAFLVYNPDAFRQSPNETAYVEPLKDVTVSQRVYTTCDVDAAAWCTETVRMAMGSVTRTKEAELKEALSHLVGLKNRKPDSQYSINVTLSDEISLDRDLPETRPPVCATLPYDTAHLPKCTIIIPFFNEAPTMILRALHSVLNRSPAHLLQEIILGLVPLRYYCLFTLTDICRRHKNVADKCR